MDTIFTMLQSLKSNQKRLIEIKLLDISPYSSQSTIPATNIPALPMDTISTMLQSLKDSRQSILDNQKHLAEIKLHVRTNQEDISELISSPVTLQCQHLLTSADTSNVKQLGRANTNPIKHSSVDVNTHSSSTTHSATPIAKHSVRSTSHTIHSTLSDKPLQTDDKTIRLPESRTPSSIVIQHQPASTHTNSSHANAQGNKSTTFTKNSSTVFYNLTKPDTQCFTALSNNSTKHSLLDNHVTKPSTNHSNTTTSHVTHTAEHSTGTTEKIRKENGKIAEEEQTREHLHTNGTLLETNKVEEAGQKVHAQLHKIGRLHSSVKGKSKQYETIQIHNNFQSIQQQNQDMSQLQLAIQILEINRQKKVNQPKKTAIQDWKKKAKQKSNKGIISKFKILLGNSKNIGKPSTILFGTMSKMKDRPLWIADLGQRTIYYKASLYLKIRRTHQANGKLNHICPICGIMKQWDPGKD